MSCWFSFFHVLDSSLYHSGGGHDFGTEDVEINLVRCNARGSGEQDLTAPARVTESAKDKVQRYAVVRHSCKVRRFVKASESCKRYDHNPQSLPVAA